MLRAATWVWLLFLWMLFAASTSRWEWVAGAGGAVLALTGSEIVRAQPFAHFEPHAAWLAQAWRLPWEVLKGTVVVSGALVRNPLLYRSSWLRTLAFGPVPGAEARVAAQRALAIGWISVAPDWIVLSIDIDRGRLIAHQIGTGPVSKLAHRLGVSEEGSR